MRPGDRVALTVPNGLCFLDGYFGALYAGCTVLPVPPMSAPPELAARLSHARCAALISDESTHFLAETALLEVTGTRSLDADPQLRQEAAEPPVRVFKTPDTPTPAVQLLSNGR